MKILVLGVTGMLGHVLFKTLNSDSRYEAKGTCRNLDVFRQFFTKDEAANIINGVDADNFEAVLKAFSVCRPDAVINCIGIIKQLPQTNNLLITIGINSYFPHRIAQLAEATDARMIHISTDCVFNGKKGGYTEEDLSDAEDLYGRSKYLGEVNYPHAVTLRTSIIGHELKSSVSLVDWFLSEKGPVKGFSEAQYSGFSTVEMTRIILDYVLPDPSINGLYHVSSNMINKYDLLKLVAKHYEKNINIEKYDDFVINRSLLSERFKEKTGYNPPKWDDMIRDMCIHYKKNNCYDFMRSKRNV